MRCPVCGKEFDTTGVVNKQGVVMCADCASMMATGPSSQRTGFAAAPESPMSTRQVFENAETRMLETPVLDADTLEAELAAVVRDKNAVMDEVAKRIIGQEDVLRQMLAAVFSRGYCLLEGVPGLAKTEMVKTLARTLDCSFKRVQFTPDLMPFDITGTEVVEESEGRRRFTFVRGPLFANIVLADEINRTPPKTQAALLEAMQERQVTIGNNTHPLPDPFFVIATQNPIEQEGTYELPEAQLDRFMFNIHVDYPSLTEEERILAETTRRSAPEVQQVLGAERIRAIQHIVAHVEVPPFLIAYVARLVRSTRPSDEMAPAFVREVVDWGVSPRAGQYLILGAKAMAAMEGRAACGIGDVRAVAVPVLRHRVATNFQAQAEGIDSLEIIKKLIQTVPEPQSAKYG